MTRPKTVDFEVERHGYLFNVEVEVEYQPAEPDVGIMSGSWLVYPDATVCPDQLHPYTNKSVALTDDERTVILESLDNDLD